MDARENLPALPRQFRPRARERRVLHDAPAERFAFNMRHEEASAEPILRRKNVRHARARHAVLVRQAHKLRLNLDRDRQIGRNPQRRRAPQHQAHRPVRSFQHHQPQFLARTARQRASFQNTRPAQLRRERIQRIEIK